MTSPARSWDVAASWKKKRLRERIIRSGLLSSAISDLDTATSPSFVDQLNRHLLSEHDHDQLTPPIREEGVFEEKDGAKDWRDVGNTPPSSYPSTPRYYKAKDKDNVFKMDGDFEFQPLQNFPLETGPENIVSSFTSALSDGERRLLADVQMQGLLLDSPQQSMTLSKKTQEKLLKQMHQSQPKQGDNHKTSFWATVFNIVNLYVGLGLLSKPYALRLGGWLSLVFLAVICFVFCLTGKMLVWCFESAQKNTKNTDSHSSLSYLGEVVFGKRGKQFITGMIVTEFFGALCMSLIIVWTCLSTLLPQIQLKNIILACSVPILLSLVFADNYARLSGISIFGFVCNCLLVGSLLYVISQDPNREKILPYKPGETNRYTLLDMKSLPLAVGIFIVSLAGHASLPVYRNNMKEPQHFNQVLNVSFVIMLTIYSLMAICGYYYFGNWSKVLITTNIDEFMGNTSEVGKHVNQFVVACVGLASYSSVGPLISIISDTFEDSQKIDSKTIGLLVRMGILSVGTTISRITWGYLGYFESILGGVCSICISLLLPVIFYYKLFENAHSPLKSRLLFMSIWFIIALIAVIFSVDLWVLIEDLRN